jgi:hypothetical protein
MVGDKTVSMQMRDMLSTEQRFAINRFSLSCALQVDSKKKT